MPREKKEKPPKKEKAPKKQRAKKEQQDPEQKEESLLQKLMRQAKIKGDDAPEAEAPADGTDPEAQEEEEEGRRKPKLILLIAAAVLVVAAVAVLVIFVILPKFSGGDDPEASQSPEPSESEPVLYDLPAGFEVGEQTVPALKPVDPDGVQADKDPWVSYTYSGMSDGGAEAAAYADTLRGEGFSVVDEEFVRTDAPDYTTRSGTVLLAKNLPRPETPGTEGADTDTTASPSPSASPSTDTSASPSPSADPSASPSADPTASPSADPSASPSTDPSTSPSADPTASPAPDGDAGSDGVKDMVLTVELVWTEDTLVVTCDQAEGRVTSPATGPGGIAIPGSAMSMSEAVDFMYALDPAVLGLEGSSMESFHIYAMEGAVKVDERLCMRLHIYSRDDTSQSNELAGIYLLSRDGQHLYLLDEKAKEVTELKLP